MTARGKNTIFRVTGIPVGARAEGALKSALDDLSLDDDADSISILRSALSHGDDTLAFGEQEEDQQAEGFLKAAILIELSSDERSSLKTRIEILPSCYYDDTRSALLHFDGGVPKFLQSSAKQLVEERQIDVYDIDLNIDRNFYGFTQMYATAGNITADVVAMAGLDGHAWESWTGRGKAGRMWLRDYFRQDFQNFRTMTYGYNSKLQAHNIDIIIDYCRGFLEEIRKVRRTKEEKERPLIFIGHGLGGIIIAQSLVKAALQKAEDSIWRATIGLVFFGVPHKGLVVSDMQQMIGKDHPRQELLGQISVKSHLLADQLANFKNIIEDRKIISFYERQQTGQLKMDSATQMWRRGNDEFATSVDEESALLQFPDNMEVKIPVNANQVTMVKFDSTGDHIYSSVVEHLKALETKGLDIVHSRFYVSQALLVSYSVPMELPFPPNHNFTGREKELSAIYEAFESRSYDFRKVVVLHGLGGIGKTQLAAQYAYSNHQHYTFVSWINASNPETISGSFLQIARQLFTQHGPNGSPFDECPDYATIATEPRITPHVVLQSGQITASETPTCVDAVKHWFCIKDNQRWLLIVDNYDDIKNIDISDYLPNCFHGHILITSRARDSSRFGKGLEVVEVELDDGMEILRKSAQYEPIIFKQEQDDAAALVAKLGALPLALDQAGAYIFSRQITFREYIQRFEQEFTELACRKPPNPVGHYLEDAVFTTWEISFSSLGPAGQKLLNLCALLDNEDIPEELLPLEKLEEEFGIDSVEDYALSLSLAKRKSHTNGFWIHPLVHYWSRERLFWCVKATIAPTALSLVAAAELKREPNNCTLERRLVPHVLLAVNYVSYLGENVTELDTIENLVGILYRHGYFTHAECLLQWVIFQQEMNLAKDDLSTLGTFHWMALVFFIQGKYDDALEWYQRALARYERGVGSGHFYALEVVNNIALVFSIQGKYHDALEWYRRALAGYELNLGKEFPSTLTVVHNMALVFSEQGKYDDALEWYIRALIGRKRTLGLDHPDTQSTRRCLEKITAERLL